MPLAERAARLPAGPSNPQCNAGLSFITLRDSAALPPGPAARRVFVERFAQLAEGAAALRAGGDARAVAAANQLASLASRAQQGFDPTPAAASAAARAQGIATGAAPEATAGAAAGGGTAPAPRAAPAPPVSGRGGDAAGGRRRVSAHGYAAGGPRRTSRTATARITRSASPPRASRRVARPTCCRCAMACWRSIRRPTDP